MTGLLGLGSGLQRRGEGTLDSHGADVDDRTVGVRVRVRKAERRP